MDSLSSHLHAVIMAGGSGTRFWPMSRKRLPKQFLALTGGKTLLRETCDRLLPLVGPDRLWVVAGAQQVDLVRREIPELPPGNLLGEPMGRNTAPCIGLVAWQIVERDPEACLLVCPSDHIVRASAAFGATVLEGVRFLQGADRSAEPWTVTFGIVPRYPATGFGYIERGESLAPGLVAPGRGFRVLRFQEKPPLDTAREYLATGRFYWNSGIFLWQASGIVELLSRYLPQLSGGLDEICHRARSQGNLAAALEAGFGSLPSISIDHGLLEKQRNVAVFAADFDWDDVGSWRAVENYAPRDEAQNSLVGNHLAVDSRGCILVGQKRMIAALGVEDLVVVETDDAILVCPRNATERVKEIVDRLSRDGRSDLV